MQYGSSSRLLTSIQDSRVAAGTSLFCVATVESTRSFLMFSLRDIDIEKSSIIKIKMQKGKVASQRFEVSHNFRTKIICTRSGFPSNQLGWWRESHEIVVNKEQKKVDLIYLARWVPLTGSYMRNKTIANESRQRVRRMLVKIVRTVNLR